MRTCDVCGTNILVRSVGIKTTGVKNQWKSEKVEIDICEDHGIITTNFIKNTILKELKRRNDGSV